jgi:hypothetical protein
VGDLTFSTLYVDASWLDSETLETVLRLADAGLPVCLRRAPKQAGHIQSPTFASQLQRLVSLSNVSSDLGKIAAGKPLVVGDDLPDYWARVDNNGDLLIFFAHPFTQDLRLPLRFGQSFTDKDLTRDVTIWAAGRSLPLKLVFKPCQSLLARIPPGRPAEFIDIAYQPPPPVPY